MIDTSTFKKSRLDHIIINGANFSSGDLVPDRTIIALNSFLNSGGNVFITGSRIGASTAMAGYSTQMYKDFFKNTIGANWISSTNLSGASLNIISKEPIFGDLASTTLKTGSYFGEHVTLNGPNSVALISYSDSTDYGAVRNSSALKNWKVVYLGVSYMEISGNQFKNDFLDRAIYWFDQSSGINEFDEVNQATLGQNYPNPANLYTRIPIGKLTTDAVLNISNIVGKTMVTIKINAGIENVDVDLRDFSTGIYFYSLKTINNKQFVKKMVVVK